MTSNNISISKKLGANPFHEDISLANRFIVVEGMDGSGKTSLCANLADYLYTSSKELVKSVYQPGTTWLAERLRSLIKEDNEYIPPAVQHMLMETARLDLLLELERFRGKHPNSWIISDRHVDSTWAYQGLEVPSKHIYAVQTLYEDRIQPSITIFLDVDKPTVVERFKLANKFVDNLDELGLNNFDKVQEGYYARIRANRECYLVLDGRKSHEEVLQQAIEGLGLQYARS